LLGFATLNPTYTQLEK